MDGDATDQISFVTASDGAFADFYGVEHDLQVRRAFLLLGRDALAHDVVADAFTEVLQRWDQIETPGPYLHRCVLNGCRDAAKRSGREELTADLPEVGERDLVDHMAGLLLELPFRQRAAVVLRFYGRLSEKEIAEQLDCAPGTVGSLIHRGVAALRGQMGNEEQMGNDEGERS